MRIIFTQKGLEFRKELKNEHEVLNQYKQFESPQSKESKKTLGYNSSKAIPNMYKSTGHDTDRSIKLPNFESMKIELIKTSDGEVMEKPVILTKELEKKNRFEVTYYDLNEGSTQKVQKMLNYHPENIHVKASNGMILPPKPDKHTHSIVDILGTVESPSHWRYFQNKIMSKHSSSYDLP